MNSFPAFQPSTWNLITSQKFQELYLPLLTSKIRGKPPFPYRKNGVWVFNQLANVNGTTKMHQLYSLGKRFSMVRKRRGFSSCDVKSLLKAAGIHKSHEQVQSGETLWKEVLRRDYRPVSGQQYKTQHSQKNSNFSRS